MKATMKYYYFCLTLLFLIKFLCKRASAQVCYTPDARLGNCIAYSSCDYMIKVVSQLNSNADFSGYSFIWQSVCDYGNGGDPIVCCPSDNNSGFNYGFIFSSLNIVTPSTNIDYQTGGWNWGDSDMNNFGTDNPTQPPIVVTPIPTYDATNDNRCGITNASHTRVVGGRDASRGAYPWIAALMYQVQGSATLRQLCGGSLITKRHVVTAAHCSKPTLKAVALGIYDINKLSDGSVINIDFNKVHEEYDAKKILNDICILKLVQDAPLNDLIRPICLPTQEPQKSMDLTGYQPFVAGWGTTSSNGPSANILQEVQVPVVSTQSCGNAYKTYFPNQVFDNRVICAGATGKDSCQGDSGGPLMLPVLSSDGNYYYYILIGVVSYGYECGQPGFPGVYTKVTTFLPWIQNKLT